MVGGRWPRSKRARASWMICALREADLVRAYVDAVRAALAKGNSALGARA